MNTRRVISVVALFAVLGAASSALQNSQDESHPPYKCGGEVTCPKVISAPDPEYTDNARKQKLHGMVQLEFVVDERGNTADIHVVKSLDPELDQQAVQCVAKWKFTPATRRGVPVPVVMNVAVNFKLY